MVHVRHHHLELVVGVHPGHQAAFEHLRALADHRLEVFEAFRGVPVHADQDESGEAQTELFAIQQGDLADDIAVIFQLLDPSRARRG